MKKIQLQFGNDAVLTKVQMKKVGGGVARCSATITCSDGSTHGGVADCSDNSSGSDSDGICEAHNAGYSTSCDCSS